MNGTGRRAGSAAAVAATVAAVVAVELRRRRIDPEGAALTAATLNGPAFALLGALILRRRPGHGLGRLYLAIGALLAAFALANSPGTEHPPAISTWFASWAWAVGPLLLLTYGTYLLPDGAVPPGRLGRWASRVAGAALALSVLYLPYDLDPMPANLVGVLPPLSQPARELGFGVWFLLAVTAILTSLASVIVRYRRGAHAERQQLRWIAFCTFLAVAIYVAGGIVTQVPGVTWEHVMAVVVLLPAVGVTTSIVRHRMFDIDRLVARTVSYLVVSLALAGVYLAVVVVVSAAVPGARGSDLAVAVSTLGAAAAFRPLRSRVQGFVDRRFHRHRYDAERLVAAFGGRLRDELDLGTVTGDLVAVSVGALRPTSASLWLRVPDGRGNGSGTLEG